MVDPQAAVVVDACWSLFERIGLPEGQFPLTQAALYLATAPKSNTALSFFDALALVQQEREADVPNHLKDGNRDKEGFGHGEGIVIHTRTRALVGATIFARCVAGQGVLRAERPGLRKAHQAAGGTSP